MHIDNELLPETDESRSLSTHDYSRNIARIKYYQARKAANGGKLRAAEEKEYGELVLGFGGLGRPTHYTADPEARKDQAQSLHEIRIKFFLQSQKPSDANALKRIKTKLARALNNQTNETNAIENMARTDIHAARLREIIIDSVESCYQPIIMDHLAGLTRDEILETHGISRRRYEEIMTSIRDAWNT